MRQDVLNASHYLGMLDHVDHVAGVCRRAAKAFEALADADMRQTLHEIGAQLDALTAENARRRRALEALRMSTDPESGWRTHG